ncbi:MAG: flagellar motor protein MotB [Leptospirales bacterium]
MAKKTRHEEHENLERWLVSYADFITLLFAFFVMLYAISSLNTGKFRVLSNAIVATFEHKKQLTTTHVIIPKDNPKAGKATPRVESVMVQAMQLLVQKFSEKGDMKVVSTKKGIVLRIQSRLLFRTGHARVLPKAFPVLKKIARLLAKSNHEIRVRGFTDNHPIRTLRYPNNWSLSTMRSVNVLTLLLQYGSIDPERIGASGFGKYRPISTNLTPDGREENRRVEIMILNRAFVPKGVVAAPAPARKAAPPLPVLPDAPRI